MGRSTETRVRNPSHRFLGSAPGLARNDTFVFGLARNDKCDRASNCHPDRRSTATERRDLWGAERSNVQTFNVLTS